MPKVLTEARRMCPELTDAVKSFDMIARRWNYGDVFGDFIDWLVFQHLLEPDSALKNPLEKYDQSEKDLFLEALKNIQTEVRKRVNRFTSPTTPKGYTPDGWYDPLGRIYECITSKYKSSAMGQYFTPESVVNMMVQLTRHNEGKDKPQFERVFDPACGSGRMGLAASTHALSQGNGCWVTMNDLDPICAKMTAVNMCLNGVVGESICMNGLEIEGDSFRFAYQIQPALAQFPQEMWEYYRMLILMKTKQDIKKQYVIKKIPYEQTFLKGANDQLLKEFEERQKIADKAEREQALKEVQDRIKSRMKGTLFDGDTSQAENAETTLKKTNSTGKRKNKTTPKPPLSGTQGSLF